jgi:hypothetical protein
MRPSVASLIAWYRGSSRAWRRAWKNGQPSIDSTDNLAPSYLFHHNSSERVCNEYERTLNLLSQYQYLIHTLICHIVYLRLFSRAHQAGQQAFSVVNRLRHRLSKGCGRVVAEGHDTRIGDLLGKEVLQPEGLRLRVCPSVDGITAEAVDGDNTKEGCSQRHQNRTKGESSQRVFQGPYSTVDNVVAS